MRYAGWVCAAVLLVVLSRPAQSDLSGMYSYDEPPPFKTISDASKWLDRIQAKGWSLETDTVLIRTDARAVHGFDEALERCRAFEQAGADVVFFEAPASREELEMIGTAIEAPLLVNVLVVWGISSAIVFAILG